MCYSMKHEVHVTMAHILEQCSIECTLFPDDHVHSKDFETKKKNLKVFFLFQESRSRLYLKRRFVY